MDSDAMVRKREDGRAVPMEKFGVSVHLRIFQEADEVWCSETQRNGYYLWDQGLVAGMPESSVVA